MALGLLRCDARTISQNLTATTLLISRTIQPKNPLPQATAHPGVLADAAHKTGRSKTDFELREISREEYERLKSLIL
jgi:hypothetical protein